MILTRFASFSLGRWARKVKETMGKDVKESEIDLLDKVSSLELEVDQLRDAVDYYKKKAEEESPAALHAELHRLQRAARSALGIIRHAERTGASRATPKASGNKYTRVAMAMKGRPSPDRPAGTLESVATCLLSALDNKPPRKVVSPEIKREEDDNAENQESL
jgi:hypothetical protein